jgi:hypothetical protein
LQFALEGSNDSSNVSTSNTKMTLTYEGNVGIGTTSPVAKIDVIGSFDALPARILRQATYGEILRIGRNGVSELASINYPADGVFAINTVGSERMRITSGGDVLIGTTTAQPGTKLQVAGSTDIWSSTNTLLRLNHNGTLGTIQSFTGGAVGIISLNPSGGNVGIGTTSPTARLAIESTTSDALRIGQTGNTTGNKYVSIGMDVTNQYARIEATRYGEVYLPIALNPSGGNVGIGTTNPYSPLQVGSYSGTGGYSY